MTRLQALEIIDAHMNRLLDPVEMLGWVWLRVVLLNISDEAWDDALRRAGITLSR